MSELVLDLETKKSFDDVGGRDNFHLLEVSLVGVFDYGSGVFSTYTEKEMPALEDLLRRADRVIGFNTKNFDYAVLQPYVSLNLKALPSLDILEEVARMLGFRVKLDSIAAATLGQKKSGDGLKALQLYKDGKMKELADYCLQDVKLTRDVYEYGATHGKLMFENRYGRPGEVPVTWKKLRVEDAPLRLAI